MTRRKARGRRGGGTVFWDAARGCYTGQFSMGRDVDTRKRRRSPKVHAATEAECWELLDAMREEHRKTGMVARRDITVQMVVRDVLDNPPETGSRKSPSRSTGTPQSTSSRLSAACGWHASPPGKWMECSARWPGRGAQGAPSRVPGRCWCGPSGGPSATALSPATWPPCLSCRPRPGGCPRP